MDRDRPRVLIIDEIPSVIRMLSLELHANGYDVEGVQIGDDLFGAIDRIRPAAAILELVLPAASGLEVLKDLRARHPDLPVIVLTTQDTEADRTECLELGAADFLGKPFSPEDLAFRIDLVTGRVPSPPADIRLGSYEVDVARRLIRKDGRPFSVTTNEWALLLALIEAEGAPVQVERLREEVLGPEGTPEIMLFWIRRLRRRMEDDPNDPRLIVGDESHGFALRAD